MGTGHSAQLKAFELLPRDYIASKHAHIDDLWVLSKPSNGALFLMREYKHFDASSFQLQARRLSGKMQLQHDNYLGLRDLYFSRSSSYCAQEWKVGAVFQAEALSLEEEVRARKQQGKPFLERELWNIMCSCTLALRFIYQHDFHQHLSLQSVLISEGGQIRVCDREVAESLWGDCARKKTLPHSRWSVLELGTVLLQAAILQPLEFEWDQDQLSAKYSELEAFYSLQFIMLLSEMLNPLCQVSLHLLQQKLNKVLRRLSLSPERQTHKNSSALADSSCSKHFDFRTRHSIYLQSVDQSRRQSKPEKTIFVRDSNLEQSVVLSRRCARPQSRVRSKQQDTGHSFLTTTAYHSLQSLQ